MRPIKVRVSGYGRLTNTSLNIDGKLIAIVGPNEAGKTTLLDALTFLGSSEPLPAARRSRIKNPVDSDNIVSVDFELDSADIAWIDGIRLDSKPHRMVASSRAGGGNVTVGFDCDIRKLRSGIEGVLALLEEVASDPLLDELLEPDTVWTDHYSDAARDFPTELRAACTALQEMAESPNDHSTSDNEDEELSTSLRQLRDALDANSERLPEIRGAFDAAVEWIEEPDPGPRVRSALLDRHPEFLMFSEHDRSLGSSYAFDESTMNDPPVALSNLARLAELDLHALYASRDDRSRRLTMENAANRRLREVFDRAWTQSNRSVQMSVDGSTLNVDIREGDERVTAFDERSAGLRIFVALIAFLGDREYSVKPVLLIDEAENHLHLDAQSDLVAMLESQEVAQSVIYTTHSPACLPPDLGTGIRCVVPDPKNAQSSKLSNHFWTEGAGFSPLMVAMGAGAAAFTPARYVVIAEGASEMLLLPTLIKSATNQTSLPFQIAPGLSNTHKDFLPELDLEGSRVAYLVDSDGGGEELRRSLVESGVLEAAIVDLGVPGIENLLDPTVYLEVVKSLLAEDLEPDHSVISDLRDKSWAKALEDWAKTESLDLPSKVAVASKLVERAPSLLTADGAEMVQKLHSRLLAALGISK
jgi:predicted ATP-dependent endonuclease of OLD family